MPGRATCCDEWRAGSAILEHLLLQHHGPVGDVERWHGSAVRARLVRRHEVWQRVVRNLVRWGPWRGNWGAAPGDGVAGQWTRAGMARVCWVTRCASCVSDGAGRPGCSAAVPVQREGPGPAGCPRVFSMAAGVLHAFAWVPMAQGTVHSVPPRPLKVVAYLLVPRAPRLQHVLLSAVARTLSHSLSPPSSPLPIFLPQLLTYGEHSIARVSPVRGLDDSPSARHGTICRIHGSLIGAIDCLPGQLGALRTQ